jgi:hypothetical protein
MIKMYQDGVAYSRDEQLYRKRMVLKIVGGAHLWERGLHETRIRNGDDLRITFGGHEGAGGAGEGRVDFYMPCFTNLFSFEEILAKEWGDAGKQGFLFIRWIHWTISQ